MQLGERLSRLREYVLEHAAVLPAPHPGCVLFFSFSEGDRQATVVSFSGATPDEAWSRGVNRLLLLKKQKQRRFAAPWLRVDWAERVEMLEWQAFEAYVRTFRRNYFRYGFTLDSGFRHALLETECNANGLFYGAESNGMAEFNAERFTAYAGPRFGDVTPPFADTRMVGYFSHAGAFCDAEGRVFPLPGPEDASALPPAPRARPSAGPDAALWAGRRPTPDLPAPVLDQVIGGAGRFLARQMREDGEFIYGYLPSKGKALTSYNVIRHAGTLLALLDTLEYNGDESLRPALDAGIKAMAGHLARRYPLPGGKTAAFLAERNGELKLGANGVALVALSRWVRLTGDNTLLPFMEELGEGIAFMRNAQTGAFNHVFDAANLALKEEQRIVYYDGEALFGLTQLYSATRDQRWLDLAKDVFEVFIRMRHWSNHDHWLSYAANEISLHLPEDRYFLFGLHNVAGYLDYILERETTFPTLLELCMAAEKMIRRLESMPEKSHLLQVIDLPRFRLASRRRAEYLLNGCFWPELAMFFPRPERIVDSFFIRHHAFRVRIDDVAHYLCGLVAYARLFAGNGTSGD